MNYSVSLRILARITNSGLISRSVLHVRQYLRQVVHCHHRWREPWSGVGRHCRRLPAGLEISLEDLQRDLDRRKPGTSRHTTQRQEADEVEILSGVFEGRTTGCSIGLLIRNTDQKSKDYSAIKDLFRPAHADYTYHHKYGERDYRGGGRSSARETAMRVAAGAIAKKFLATQGIVIRGYMSQLGPIEIPFKTWDSVEQNAFFSPDPDKVPELEAYMDQLRRDQDSVGRRSPWLRRA